MVYRLFSYSYWFGLYRPKRKSGNWGVFTILSATVTRRPTKYPVLQLFHTLKLLMTLFLSTKIFSEQLEEKEQENGSDPKYSYFFVFYYSSVSYILSLKFRRFSILVFTFPQASVPARKRGH